MTTGENFPDDPRDGAIHELSAGEGEATLRFKYDKDSAKWALVEVEPARRADV